MSTQPILFVKFFMTQSGNEPALEWLRNMEPDLWEARSRLEHGNICNNFEKITLPAEICDPGFEPASPMPKIVSEAYDRIALSIAAFEGSKASNAFTSKVDAFRASRGTLAEWTDQEERGRIIFRDEAKCVSCHQGDRGPGGALPLLTDFSYSNIGTPKNPEIFSSEPDRGLAGFLETVDGLEQYAEENEGKMKVPTLRNVALGTCEDTKDKGKGKKIDDCVPKTFMHNGYFKSLKSVVHFYNTRDTKYSCESMGFYDATEATALKKDCWPEPEVEANVEVNIMGDLGENLKPGSEPPLSEEDEDALVAFMQALSDGYILD